MYDYKYNTPGTTYESIMGPRQQQPAYDPTYSRIRNSAMGKELGWDTSAYDSQFTPENMSGQTYQYAQNQPSPYATSTRSPSFNYTTPSGSRANDTQQGFNYDAFHAAQRDTEQRGVQITPFQYQQFGGDLNQYRDLYGDTAWYDSTGNLTSNAPQGTLPDPLSSRAYFPEYRSPGQFQPIQGSTSYRDYLPQDVQSSELYKYQLKEGEKAQDRFLASRGLHNSGAAIEARNDLIARLTAEESERIAKRAGEDANRAKDVGISNASLGNEYRILEAANENAFNRGTGRTLIDLQKDQADRATDASKTNFSNLYNVLNLMLNQTPGGLLSDATTGSANAIGSSASAQGNLLTSLANALAQQAGVVPPPSEPNYNNTRPPGIYGGAANNIGYGNLLGNLIGGLSGYAS